MSEINNLFVLASRQKLRFPSGKGDLTVEQLWDLPLLSKQTTRDVKADLDTVARTISAEIKALGDESFVVTRTSPEKARWELMLEVVKFVIATKLEEAEKARKALDIKAERDRLTEILGKKEEAALLELTPEQIRERLAQLGE